MSAPQAYRSLDDADIRLFESGNFADATIVCGNRTWNVHKAILASRCKWFKAAFYGNMAEAASGQIVLQEQDPDFVDHVLRFIYARIIFVHALRDGKDIPTLCVELFRLADFFQLDALAMTAKMELKIHLRESLEARASALEIPANPLDPAEMLDSIRRAYKDNSTQPLRQMLLTFMCVRKDTYLQTAGAIALLDELPELGKDLMKTFLSVDLTTNEPNELKLPRDLPVLEAVRKGHEAYTAGGPGARIVLGFVKQPKHFNTPCVLRPRSEPVSWTKPFEAVDSATDTVLRGMTFVAPIPSAVSKIASHDRSSIVQVFYSDSAGPEINYVRFLCPADAKDYVCRYCKADPRIRQVNKGVAELLKELRSAHDNANDPVILAFESSESEEEG